MTPWGYSVDADELPPLIDTATFFSMVGAAFDADDERVAPTLEAVSAAIRGWCGWHVAPAFSCEGVTQGGGSVLSLPTLALRSVDAVVVKGVEVDPACVEFRRSGLVKARGRWPHEWGSVAIGFTSGYDVEAVRDVAAVAAQLAANSLAAAPGVRREQAGGVSIEYNQTANGVTGGVALLARDMAMLAPYRLPAVPR